jgi:hypothetical protein
MANELKFESYSETQTIAEDVDLERLVQLFVNHRCVRCDLPAFNGMPPLHAHSPQCAWNPKFSRPALGLSPASLDNAFAVLSRGSGAGGDDAEEDKAGPGIALDQLYALLQAEGERMTEDELAKAMVSLLGDTKLDELLPPTISADVFARDMVGLAQ